MQSLRILAASTGIKKWPRMGNFSLAQSLSKTSSAAERGLCSGDKQLAVETGLRTGRAIQGRGKTPPSATEAAPEEPQPRKAVQEGLVREGSTLKCSHRP